MTERELCIALNMISGIGAGRYRALLETFCTPDGVRQADRSDLMSVDGIGKVIAERIIDFDWDAELSRELNFACRGDVKIVTLADEEYPADLRELFDPPLCLYIRGELPENSEKSIAIVGSRRISNYGEKMAGVLAEDAAGCGFTVYSGMALGVDTVAHTAVVGCGGRTVGVLGGGLGQMYPRENIPLAREIIRKGGAVISEFPLNYPVNKYNFPRRNRIVAAMCRATIVVEAGLESGAMITARLATEMGREVFALPGRVDNIQAQGCHKLIKEGAGLIENFDDVLISLKSGLRPGELEKSLFDDAEMAGRLTPDCQLVYDTLKQNGDCDLERLQELTGMSSGMLLSILMKLELKLLVERDSEHFYHLRS